MIRIAQPSDIEQLKTIWTACFGNEGDYTNFAFSAVVKPEHTLAYCGVDGDVQASLCMQPAKLWSSGRPVCDASYIYGVATLPAHRGKGLSTKLMEHTHDYLRERGDACSILVPASESLFTFYGDRGYEIWSSMAKVKFTAADLPESPRHCKLTTTALEAEMEVRDKAFSGSSGYLHWGKSWLRAITAECRQLGGGVLRFDCGSSSGYAVCYFWDNLLTVKEIAGAESCLYDVLAALADRFGAGEILLYLPADSRPEFTKSALPFSMVRWYDREMKEFHLSARGTAPYIAHVLD